MFDVWTIPFWPKKNPEFYWDRWCTFTKNRQLLVDSLLVGWIPGPPDRRPPALQEPRCRSGSTWMAGDHRSCASQWLVIFPVVVNPPSCWDWSDTSKGEEKGVPRSGTGQKCEEIKHLQWGSGSFLVSLTSHFPVITSWFVPFGAKINVCCVSLYILFFKVQISPGNATVSF